MQTIKEETRKARKQHNCDLCGKSIPKDEEYNYAFVVDGGDSWGFKAHLKCRFIMHELWQWFDPDEGLTHEHFEENLPEYCELFVCPHCPDFYQDENEDNACKLSKCPGIDCIDKIVKRLEEYALKKEKIKDGWRLYQFVEVKRQCTK